MKYNLVIKPQKFDNFTIVPNNLLRHKGISLGATGLYAWLFSHKHDQQITIEFISGHFKEGRDAIRSKINELIDSGFLTRERVLENGKFKGYNYILSDKTEVGKNRCRKKPMSENPTQSNTNNNIYNNINNINKALPHFYKLFDDKYLPKTPQQQAKWIKCIDECIRLDNFSLQEIYLICKHTRQNEFWSNNFLTLLKLRNNDKNGIKYIHRFHEDYKKYNKPSAYKKIKNLVEFKIYTDVNGDEKLGAITKTTKLNQYNLSQILDSAEIIEVMKYLKNGKSN